MHEFAWRRTGDQWFPFAARENGRWALLRRNDFPDHPLWTLFVDGEVSGDLDDWPDHLLGEKPGHAAPALDATSRRAALQTVRGLRKYGAEVGQACQSHDCCGCIPDEDQTDT